jgi:hypothetical protein
MISKKIGKINEIQLYICYLFYILFTVNYNIFSCNLFVLYILNVLNTLLFFIGRLFLLDIII